MEAETQVGRSTLLDEGLHPSVTEQWRDRRRSLFESSRTWLADGSQDQEELPRSVCAHLIETYWSRRTQGSDRWWRPWELGGGPLPLPLQRQCQQAVAVLDDLPLVEAAYLISTVYTALLPADIRAARGAFYTPPALVDRLLDLVGGEDLVWSKTRVLDPACGGGAFLVPVAARILEDPEVQSLEPDLQLEQLEALLAGIEIDPFASWMTQSFLQLLTHQFSERAERPLQVTIHRADALELALTASPCWDLVIGNPPYGKTRLAPRYREAFGRSLFGHANVYGLFLDAALRWRAPSGLIAFVTPTSFLGGRYFCRLRNLLLEEAPPRIIDIIEARTGVFDFVQQEACLTVFGPSSPRSTQVHLLRLEDEAARVSPAGSFELPTERDAPWVLPRTAEQACLLRQVTRLRTRLHHLGYKASTGPLVWNRHKTALRSSPTAATDYPLIWAEAVRPNRFSFEYRSRAHAPFVSVEADQSHLLDRGPCVLVQRTTAKEQRRRLVACAVPGDFLERWEYVVVENHVNILRTSGSSTVKPSALAAVLNTETVDQVFRCLSGSVAVSATELHALPLPPLDTFRQVELLLQRSSPNGQGEELDPQTRRAIEAVVAGAYGADSC